MDRIELCSEETSVAIATKGAELQSWVVGGTPLLWKPDPRVWADTAPILFPVVGWTRGAQIQVGGRSYPLGVHGFARELPFSVLQHSSTHAILECVSSDETRRHYPFEFRLVVEYVLDGPSLSTTLHVHNIGAVTMPYACGLHPGFRWPFAGGAAEDYTIVFDRIERAAVPVISPDGLFTRDLRPVPLSGRRLRLSRELMANEALCFLHIESRDLRFVHRDGAAIRIALADFPHVALWSRPSGEFLSIEAWTGHGDHVDADGDLMRKPSMRHVEPGEVGHHAAKFSFRSPEEL